MSKRFDAGWTDDEFDSFVRAEMAVMRDTTPVPALRSSAVRARVRLRWPWSAPPDRPHRLAPLAAALALAVLVAAGGGSWLATHRERGSGAPGPVGAPSARPTAPAPAATMPPSPSPSASPALPPPTVTSTVRAGVPLFYYRASTAGAGPVQLVAVDWSGAERGRVSLSHDDSVTQSPDGARLLIGSVVYSSAGTVVGRIGATGPSSTWLRWADDGSRLCGVETVTKQTSAGGASLQAWLDVYTFDGQVRHVAALPPPPSDQSAWSGIGCSARQDRATLLLYGQDGLAIRLLTVRLSTGAVLSQHDFAQDTGMVGTASADERYLVVIKGSQSGPQPGVLDVVTNQLTTRLPGNCWPIGFTPDASQVVCSTQVASNPAGTVSLVNWRTGHATWLVQGFGGLPSDVVLQPGGTLLAIAWSVASPGGMPDSKPMNVDILVPGGVTTTVRHLASGAGGMVSDF